VTRLLREELGYQHLVVTDDLEMGAISRHCDIDAATIRAFLAGEDMLLICAHAETIHKGYHALLHAAKKGRIPKDRLRGSLERIAEMKGTVNPPLPLDLEKLDALSTEIAMLNQKLHYTYGGTVL
jgi:beta-N-acetylhexosaminidase